MEHHRNTNYHKYAVERARNFVSVMEGQTRDITESFNEENKKIARENRERLCAIVDTILFCGRQELPLRGNQDSGEIGIIDPLYNDGNFRALLRFRAQADDEVLKNHLISQSNHSRAMYTSSVIQNEIIDLCGNAIQEQIINRVKQSGFFAVLADETQDISRHQQLSLYLRTSIESFEISGRDEYVELHNHSPSIPIVERSQDIIQAQYVDVDERADQAEYAELKNVTLDNIDITHNGDLNLVRS
ncbi:unnamed protein product [Diabrotica balteata]|uniref:DUF4371 domain-containing protein n=1 Tax=Diabrotica balteata TaxID=107213 RepID=A0A9N9XI82_DIABA|nr:unnamed protein product [Diabrotica balteata]